MRLLAVQSLQDVRETRIRLGNLLDDEGQAVFSRPEAVANWSKRQPSPTSTVLSPSICWGQERSSAG